MQFNNDKKFKINSNIISSSISNEIILLNIESGKYIEISGSGKDIWHLLAESESIEYDQIITNIISNHNGAEKALVKDIDDFLIHAVKLGLIYEK
tara:strand:- start:254 stop:538 length:285 start_codon:yes stop_codon:yes gene_type:complete